jgi:hypothetical protein
MEFNYREFLPAEFDDSSRVWIYQSNRLFSPEEAFQIENLLKSFTANWNSHGTPVNGFAKLFFGYFIILIADERSTDVSGCSTDSSVHTIREIEKAFDVRLFDRQLLAFSLKGKVQLIPLVQLAPAMALNRIQPETLYFNNTVLTKKELENNWIIPVRDSWLASRLPVSGQIES